MFLIRFCNKIRSYTNSSTHSTDQNANITHYISYNYYTKYVPFLVLSIRMNINTYLDSKSIFREAQMPEQTHNILIISTSVGVKKR